jgi:selenocysteine lyase/cysteine desulfurase
MSAPPFDVERVRKDFPILAQTVHGKPLVFLDSAASAQKPRAVIDAMVHLYTHDYANVHRGVYELSVRATQALEDARAKVAGLLGAETAHEIVLVRNATEAINLVARTWRTSFPGRCSATRRARCCASRPSTTGASCCSTSSRSSSRRARESPR